METQIRSNRLQIADRQSNADEEKPRRLLINPESLARESSSKRESGNDEYEYLTGFKLAIVLFLVTLVFFLVMLDLSIVATVSQVLTCF